MKLTDNLNTVWLYNYYGTNHIWFAKDDQEHNTNGPSFMKSSGFKQYRTKGRYHNAKKPSIVYPDGGELYFLDDEWLTKKEWLDAIRG